MNKSILIEKWQEKHSDILSEYSKGHKDNEVMKMYRTQMKNVLEFIDDIKNLNGATVKLREGGEFELDFCFECYQMTNHIARICQKCKPPSET
ncbi:unnamed protein product [marine sediment metagenome]|uniref:Uncharacterized protein n=1 Tax=marine sediment metagenome TaxID=412755 RepID=X0ZHL6_9ZZZZ